MAPSVTRDIPLGTVLRDTYEIVGVLGRGGMGTVFLANHLRLPGRQVAIKVLRNDAGLGKDVFVRFRREAEIASRLGHPNIVEVLDFDHLQDGSPFLVMECLRGQSLSRRMRRGPLTLEEVFFIARQMGSALQVTHRAGIVHRDLKPGNVFLVSTEVGGVAVEHVKLLDFGISKVIDSQSVNTQGGVLLGTPQYMAPEQAQGKNQEVDPRTDIFSFGCMVFEMLARRLPFKEGPLPELIYRIVYDPPERLESLVPGVPAHVVAAIDRALQKRPSDRYPDVGGFIEDLTGQPLQSPSLALSSMPTMAVRPSQIETVGSRGQPVPVESVSSKSETVSYRRRAEEPRSEDRSAKRPVVNVQLHEVSNLPEGAPEDGSPPRPDAASFEGAPEDGSPPQPDAASFEGAPSPEIPTQVVHASGEVTLEAPPFLETRRARKRWWGVAAVVLLVGAGVLAVGLRPGSSGGTALVPGAQGRGPEVRQGVAGTQSAPAATAGASSEVGAAVSGTVSSQAAEPGAGGAESGPPDAASGQVGAPGAAQTPPPQNGTAQTQPSASGAVQGKSAETGTAQAEPAQAGTSPAQPRELPTATGTSPAEPENNVRAGQAPEPLTAGKGSTTTVSEAALVDLMAAERALTRGDVDEALHLARRSQRVQITGTSFSLLTRAHCRQKDLSNALTAWKRVPAWERTKVRLYCKQYDIAL